MDETPQDRSQIQAKRSQGYLETDSRKRSGRDTVHESTLGRIPKFNTIDYAENRNLDKAMRHPLSGYLGGVDGGGCWVKKLSSDWCEAFKVKYSIPCNSATSGLLAACMAAGIGPGDTVWAPSYSMSATAACAKVLGAPVVFIDIETMRFSMNMYNF